MNEHEWMAMSEWKWDQNGPTTLNMSEWTLMNEHEWMNMNEWT